MNILKHNEVSFVPSENNGKLVFVTALGTDDDLLKVADALEKTESNLPSKTR